ncbi:uncharacterized protein LOC132561529 [Ylistrum balloti]|uniref:uncharacterized protein LOC132561529 n=1 Tax=Ylistrum balloti TaxID=509963 RepID=UPI002905E0B0|nr:uncharacterized protein LOC132561529 [Ylistrum balloti]XP_060082213.1 uncharacterized protein LOC132561529 [Ylistrum balloti]XP_060082214.1 uncharacterized protein LOC132561529 [Ylistrum balloti]
MLPCSLKQFPYDPFKQYCTRDGLVRSCDPSMCKLGEKEWERMACSLYCGDYSGEKDGNVQIWMIAPIAVGVICVVIIIILSVVIKRLWPRKQNKKFEQSDSEETKVFIGASSELDSAVGSDVSHKTGSGHISWISPQNNHVDPHTQRDSSVAMAITSGNKEIRGCHGDDTLIKQQNMSL